MVRLGYLPLRPEDLIELDGAVRALARWRTKVRPYGPEYFVILRVIDDLNELADIAGAPPPFPPAR